MKMIILDRDGVINKLVYRSKEEPLDSPMYENEIHIYEHVPSALKRFNDNLFSLAIATNQPSAAKGKTTYEQLDFINNKIVKICESSGAKFSSIHSCQHKQEDDCKCRKPNAGMLEIAFPSNYIKSKSWMVGDRSKDIIAGVNFGLNTALINYDKKEADILNSKGIVANYYGNNLEDFASFLLGE